jgi:hypothetical protein
MRDARSATRRCDDTATWELPAKRDFAQPVKQSVEAGRGRFPGWRPRGLRIGWHAPNDPPTVGLEVDPLGLACVVGAALLGFRNGGLTAWTHDLCPAKC